LATSQRTVTPVTPGDTDSLYNPPYAHTRAHERHFNGNRCPPVSPVSPGPRPIAEVLADIAERLRYLAPDHRDPEAFHLVKSDLVHELRRLARRSA
jgi:hypothetical protein